jgi:aerobic C4-dicarboxylate transport protein
MIIAPVIFCTVVSGIAGMESMKSVGKTGGVALLYFEIVSTIALLIGLLVINIWKPGVGMNVDPSTLDTSGISKFVESGQQQSTVDFFMHIIPNTVVGHLLKVKSCKCYFCLDVWFCIISWVMQVNLY